MKTDENPAATDRPLPFPVLHAAEQYQEIGWEGLVPKGWDPSKEIRALDLGQAARIPIRGRWRRWRR
jgi:hypothetical protein